MTPTPAPIPEAPLPDYLQAITELTRETEYPTLRRYLRDYAGVLLVMIGYGVVTSWNSTDFSGTNFFGVMLIVIMLQGVEERRAQRRLRLIHKVLLQLMHRTRSAD